MPIQYERDDLTRRARIAITGPFDPAELLTVLERHRREGGWEYGLLYDFRYMTGEPTKDALREFAAVTEPRPGEPPRGPVAMLTHDVVTYSRACTYAAMVKKYALIGVFQNMREADAWLTEKT